MVSKVSAEGKVRFTDLPLAKEVLAGR